MGDYLSECLGGVFSRVIQRRSLIKEKLAFWNGHVSDRKFALKVAYDLAKSRNKLQVPLYLSLF